MVVADDGGARDASHSLRAAGWGGVHFETNPAAAARVALGGRAVVLNVARADESDVTDALATLGDSGHDWRVPPPEMSQEEWSVLYALDATGSVEAAAERLGMTVRMATRRISRIEAALDASTVAGVLGAFAPYRLPTPG